MSSNNDTVELDTLRRQWLLLVVTADECAESCESNLLKIRQLRLMQGRHMKRIRSIWIHSNANRVNSSEMMMRYQGIESYYVESQALQKWQQALAISPQHNRIYIIDPVGNLILSYPEDADPGGIEKDIRRLLKTSQIG